MVSWFRFIVKCNDYRNIYAVDDFVTVDIFFPKHVGGRVLCEYLPSGCVLVVSGDLDLRLHAPPALRAVSASLSGGEKFKTLHQQKPLL